MKKGWLEEFVGEENGLSPRIPDVAAQPSDTKTRESMNYRLLLLIYKQASEFSECVHVQNKILS